MMDLVTRALVALPAYFAVLMLVIFQFQLIGPDTSPHIATLLRSMAALSVIVVLVDAARLGTDWLRR